MSTIASSAAMAEWQTMLDRIEESVTRALADTDRRERAMGEEPSAPSDVAINPAELDERLAGLEQRFDKARALAGEIEAMLRRDEAEVQSWRDAAVNARQRLDAAGRL